ncbi:MAG: Rnase Y domain-containing protein [Candidatus Dormibacteraeota bacterium]|nr:Rnase Y domain-containing protein [Candidatus Dormibacteraeota bacterium]
MIVVLAVAVVVVALVGVGAVIAARRPSEPTHRPTVASDPAAAARARAEADRVIAEARNQALAAREAVREEVRTREQAVEATDALVEERERTYRDRRAVFDDRRHLHKKRREEIDERIAAVAAARADVTATFERAADLDRATAERLVLERIDNDLAAEHPALVEAAMFERAGDAEPMARSLIVEAMERQLSGHADGVPRVAPLSLEELDEHGRERLLSALSVIAEDTGMELGLDEDRAQATLRGMDPIGREVARQAALEVVDRKLQAADVPPLLLRTRGSLSSKVRQLGEQALWEMQMEGRPELAELMGTLHYRFSYGQNALLHCEETGHICGVLAAELGMSQTVARDAGMLHDIGKAVDHDVEGSHAIIGGELLRVLGMDPAIIHAVKAHHFDEEPTTDLAMLTICADAISASRPGARRDTLATYLARLEQLQTIATRHSGVERAFPLQAGREVRIFVRAKQVKDTQVAELSSQIAREIETEMQYPGMIKVTVIRETTATATAPAQIAAVQEANRRRATNGEDEAGGTGGATDEPAIAADTEDDVSGPG